MKISESSYFYDPKVSRAEREEQDADLRGKIEEIRVELPRYGYRMLVPELKKQGVNVGERRVRRVLKKFSLQIRPLKKFVRTTVVDMRKSINGLTAIVQEEMKLDLKRNALFIFTNKRRTHMKIVYFDKSGFALWLKRLEGSKFSWPKNLEKEVIEIPSADMELLLDGINIWTRFESVHFETVI